MSGMGEGADLKLNSFRNTFKEVHQKRDPSTGLYGDNKNTTFYKLQQDLKAKIGNVGLLTQNLKASEVSLKQSMNVFCYKT